MKFDTERTVQYGPCLVGKRAGALVKFWNDGDYVLNGAIIANYPIRANKTEISVSGNGHDSLELTWIPTGCYELKSTVSVETNAGNFLINVRGNGVFPKLKAAPSVLDFGVCAIGHEYAKTLKITNLGECTTRWNIPTMPSGFQCSAGTGELKSGESDRVEVTFVAANKQARMGSFIIESRGKYRTSCGKFAELKLTSSEEGSHERPIEEYKLTRRFKWKSNCELLRIRKCERTGLLPPRREGKSFWKSKGKNTELPLKPIQKD